MNACKSLLAVCLLGAVGCAANAADTAGPSAFAQGPGDPAVAQPVSLTLERTDGSTLPAFFHLGGQYVAGEIGERYQLRVTNHSNERVEAVVSVDGRDVITGDPGNFKRQRGYVIEPYSSVVVSGFRQSLDRVAAFRFSDREGSYTAQWGTPQNAGVVGVAVFREKERRKRQKHAYTTTPGSPGTFAADEAAGEPFPGSARKSSSAPPSAEDAEAAAPAAPADAVGGSRGFAPAPPRANELGTAYGESVDSSVREIDFKRRRRGKPDALIAVFYDSLDGLAARGVPVHGRTPAPVAVDPNPFPG
jgi:hypothetical protein